MREVASLVDDSARRQVVGALEKIVLLAAGRCPRQAEAQWLGQRTARNLALGLGPTNAPA